MLNEVFQFLKDRVNDHLRLSTGWNPTDGEREVVMFPGSEGVETPDFKSERVTLLLVNLEEDHAARAADPHRMLLRDGTSQLVKPPIHLNVYVLFVARFKQYDQSMQYLSRILEFFQGHRAFDQASAPGLGDRIDKLVPELLTLSFLEQNNLWGVLRAAYHPSLLYRLRMIVFRDERGLTAPAVVETIAAAAPGGVA